MDNPRGESDLSYLYQQERNQENLNKNGDTVQKEFAVLPGSLADIHEKLLQAVNTLVGEVESAKNTAIDETEEPAIIRNAELIREAITWITKAIESPTSTESGSASKLIDKAIAQTKQALEILQLLSESDSSVNQKVVDTQRKQEALSLLRRFAKRAGENGSQSSQVLRNILS